MFCEFLFLRLNIRYKHCYCVKRWHIPQSSVDNTHSADYSKAFQSDYKFFKTCLLRILNVFSVFSDFFLF